MISKDLTQKVLKEALSSGADFSEIYIEEAKVNTASLSNGKVEDILSGKNFGAGIRVFSGLKSVYVYTNNVTEEGLLKCARDAASAISGSGGKVMDLVLKSHTNINPVILSPDSISISKKVNQLKTAYKVAKDYSKEIVQVIARYSDTDKKVYIANSEGLLTSDRRCRTRLIVQSVASDGVENQTGYYGPGASMGFEFYDNIDVEWYARESSRIAKDMLYADKCPSGTMDVVIDNGFGGVIFHEACGHSLEATSVAKGLSVFSKRLGDKIASPLVTAIDDGTIPNEWGSITIDDEGNKTRRNVLIEDGILKGYMIDKLNGRRMGMEATGSSRRESYKYAPTSRMTNTFIAPGKSSFEEIISSTNNGLYAKHMGGGSVNPATGEFNFSVLEGYIIKNGKIDKPVRGATLIGKGEKVLKDIDMVGNNLSMGQGMCGSISGSIPTNVGQPTIRVKDITVGGGE